MYAQLYQAHHMSHTEDLPFWQKLASRQKGPILELGCGTGRVCIALAHTGYTVYGLDHDAEMLAVLQFQASPEQASRCPVFQADMTAYRLACQFPLILLPCNTLSALAAGARRATLARVYEHLSPHGLFAASLPNLALLRRLPRRVEPEIEEIFPHPIDGEPVQVSSTWQRSAGFFTTFWHYDHLLPDGRVDRFSAQVSHQLLSVDETVGEFRQAGLTIETVYGDFDQSPYTQDAPQLIILANRV
jgi:SAM-dependent methyltransferase